MTAARMLATARQDLGLSGRPNKITREYAGHHGDEFLNAPWCDMSVTYWARHSDTDGVVLPEGDRAFTVWHAEDGERAGRWYAGTPENIRRFALPGAVVFFDWSGSKVIGQVDHVGIVEINLGDGRVQTIEGNTGDACKRRVRAADVIAGFWNPDYGGDMTAKEIADAVYERFTHTLTADLWAVREGLLAEGQKVDPRTAFRQIWAYVKDSYAQSRAIMARLDAQDATIRALVDVIAARDEEIDVDALVARIRAEIEQVTIRLDVPDDAAPAT